MSCKTQGCEITLHISQFANHMVENAIQSYMLEPGGGGVRVVTCKYRPSWVMDIRVVSGKYRPS